MYLNFCASTIAHELLCHITNQDTAEEINSGVHEDSKSHIQDTTHCNNPEF
jgi:hypothetical protein